MYTLNQSNVGNIRGSNGKREPNALRALPSAPAGFVNVSPSRTSMQRRSPERQACERQIEQLKASLAKNMKQLQFALNHGKTENAYALCALVSRKRIAWLHQVERLADIHAKEAQAEPAPIIRKPETITIAKRKGFKRWSTK